MSYNDYIGRETIDREFKELCMELSENIDHHKSIELLKSGKWTFNRHIIDSLSVYIQKYLPKYVASVSHQKTRLEKFTLYIGVDDKGYIKGVPFQGQLDINVINAIIYDVVKSSFSNKNIDTILASINLEIQQLSYQNISEKEYSFDPYIYFENSNSLKRRKIEEMIQSRNSWNKYVRSQSEKLYKNLNKDRYDFLDYLKDRKIPQIKDYSHTYSHLFYLCDVPSYYDMIVDIKTKTFKDPKAGIMRNFSRIVTRKLPNVCHSKINESIIFYHFGRYKDLCIDASKIVKPPKTKSRLFQSFPSKLLSRVSSMIPCWLSRNSNMNLYLIKIHIDKTCFNDSDDDSIETCIPYFNHKKRTFEECYRALSPHGPITVTY